MSGNQSLINQLIKLLPRKQSRDYYAMKLGISMPQLEKLLDEINRNKPSKIKPVAQNVTNQVVNYNENVEDGKSEIVYNSSEEIRSIDDLIQKCKIDTEKWNIDKYIQNYWGNSENPYWQVKAWLSVKTEKQLFQNEFIKFLSGYKPSARKLTYPKETNKPCACLVINKQDSHLNKHDVDGNNSITERGELIKKKVNVIVGQAKLSNHVESIKYIIGSDEFNSEWTNATTKGTPQQNIKDYQASFEDICNHEIQMINMLLESANFVDVIYVPGNHDEYVGWHMIKWLEAYFRNEVEDSRLEFDSSHSYRKYESFGRSAMMFNHGDAIKPAKLASIFPMEFRDEWSNYETYYIFTGDKHHELSQDFNGIKFYQIPAFSNAKSKWDAKNGYSCSKGEVTAFLIDEVDGMTNIFKQYL